MGQPSTSYWVGSVLVDRRMESASRQARTARRKFTSWTMLFALASDRLKMMVGDQPFQSLSLQQPAFSSWGAMAVRMEVE